MSGYTRITYVEPKSKARRFEDHLLAVMATLPHEQVVEWATWMASDPQECIAAFTLTYGDGSATEPKGLI